MRRSISFLILVTLVITACASILQPGLAATPASAAASVQAPVKSAAPSVDELTGILLDATTGEVLWQKNPDQRRPIASTTKIMTAILAIESDRLDNTVTCTTDVIAANRWGIKLMPTEQLKLHDLLYALMLSSANDSAVAIADAVGGSVDNFVSMMNLKAINLGAVNTNYVNPHGLPQGAPYSTARDLSTITRYALKNRIFRQVVSTRTATIRRTASPKPYPLENTNKLLWSYPGVVGVKTGHTKSAGFCLVSAAERNGVSLILVLLGGKAPDTVFDDSADLLDYGFNQYENRRVVVRGPVYESVKTRYDQRVDLIAASDVTALVRRSVAVTMVVKNAPLPATRIKKGTNLGQLSVMQAGRLITKVPLVAKADVEQASFLQVIGFYWGRLWAEIL